MATILLTASYTSLGALSVDYVYMRSTKTQKNPFTDEISYYGLSGDVAGLMMEKLNSDTSFAEVTGSRNSSIKNCLAVNEYTSEEKKDMMREGYTIIDRAVDKFYILNSDIIEDEGIYDNINVKFILMYLNRSVSKYLDSVISEGIQDKTVQSQIRRYVNRKMKVVNRYMSDLQVRVIFNKRTITVELFESPNKTIRNMIFNVMETK